MLVLLTHKYKTNTGSVSQAMDKLACLNSSNGAAGVINKLSHPMIDIRLRSTKNIIFKIKNNLLVGIMNDDDMKKELFHQLMQAVKLSVEELRQDEISPLSKRKYEDQLQQLMCLITTICDLHREEFVAEFSFDMTNSLNSLIESEYIGGITKTSVQKVCMCQCFMCENNGCMYSLDGTKHEVSHAK